MIRKQQQLRDKTFKQGQDSRRDRARGKPNDQSMSDLQQDQQGLRDRLKQLQQQLAKRGMGQGQKGQNGEPGDDGDPQAGDGDDGLNSADNAMNDAGSSLGEGNADSAVDSQGRALEGMKKSAQGLAEQMQQEGQGQGDGPGDSKGRQAAGKDPLGRPLNQTGRDSVNDMTVQIPGEIEAQRVRRILEELRRRLADPLRPQTELDYIERLLKDY